MANLRWYDKDRYLSAFMTLLESLSEEVQTQVALDILGEIPKVISTDIVIFMDYVEKNDPKKYNRWYDKNPNIHKTVEAIRQLSESERDALCVNIAEIVLIHTNKNLKDLI